MASFMSHYHTPGACVGMCEERDAYVPACKVLVELAKRCDIDQQPMLVASRESVDLRSIGSALFTHPHTTVTSIVMTSRRASRIRFARDQSINRSIGTYLLVEEVAECLLGLDIDLWRTKEHVRSHISNHTLSPSLSISISHDRNRSEESIAIS